MFQKSLNIRRKFSCRAVAIDRTFAQRFQHDRLQFGGNSTVQLPQAARLLVQNLIQQLVMRFAGEYRFQR